MEGFAGWQCKRAREGVDQLNWYERYGVSLPLASAHLRDAMGEPDDVGGLGCQSESRVKLPQVTSESCTLIKSLQWLWWVMEEFQLHLALKRQARQELKL